MVLAKGIPPEALAGLSKISRYGTTLISFEEEFCEGTAAWAPRRKSSTRSETLDLGHQMSLADNNPAI